MARSRPISPTPMPKTGVTAMKTRGSSAVWAWIRPCCTERRASVVRGRRSSASTPGAGSSSATAATMTGAASSMARSCPTGGSAVAPQCASGSCIGSTTTAIVKMSAPNASTPPTMSHSTIVGTYQ